MSYGGQADAAIVYRLDEVAHRWIAILPRHCRRGQHDFVECGYIAQERQSQWGNGPDAHPEPRLVVMCRGCDAGGRPDHSWYLAPTAPAPDSVELDNAPYLDVRLAFGERPADLPQFSPFREILAYYAAREGSASSQK